MKLFERKKAKTDKTEKTDAEKSKDKLMITVQEYTNFVNLDVKHYLLEMIYNYCKTKK